MTVPFMAFYCSVMPSLLAHLVARIISLSHNSDESPGSKFDAAGSVKRIWIEFSMAIDTSS